MASQGKPVHPFSWVLITGFGFLLFVGMAVVFSLYHDRLSLISTPVYFFLLVAIGLVAAGFLFGALRSHAKYSGKAYNGSVELGGPVVVLAMVVLLGYQFRPAESFFTTTVNVFTADSTHAPVKEGKLQIYYGSVRLSKNIDDGQVVIHDIPADYRGKDMAFVPEVAGYDSRPQTLKMPQTEGTLSLYLQRIPDSVLITGIVLSKAGKSVDGAELLFADGLTKTVSDAYGNFRIKIPLKDGSETNLRIYKNGKMLSDRRVLLSGQVSMTIHLD